MFRSLLTLLLSLGVSMPALAPIAERGPDSPQTRADTLRLSREELKEKIRILRLKTKDSDHDGLSNLEERHLFKTDPKNPDSDGDGILDAEEDSNSDGIPNEAQSHLKKYQAALRKLLLQASPTPTPSKKPTPTLKPTPKPSTTPTSARTPSATPTAASSPSPKPTSSKTPTPNPTSSGSFDSGGNTTKFGIPAGMTGNITLGKGVWSSRCTGCHTEKLNKTYSQISSALDRPEMLGVTASSQDVANLTAYLNRFQP